MVEGTQANILLVTGDRGIVDMVHSLLARWDARVVLLDRANPAAPAAGQRHWDLVMADLAARGDVCSLVRGFRRDCPESPIAVFARRRGRSSPEAALPEGCAEWFPRPVDGESLGAFLASILGPQEAPAEEDPAYRAYQIVGRSPELLQVVQQARTVAPTLVPVLITGESGTGKELVARLIHRKSARAAEAFVRVNCAAMSESLLESELFGHERGAFTGACEQHRGRFERAHRGSLLLDEISETSPKLQAKLLRVLEQQDFERLGGDETLCVNVRVISTTNRNLGDQIERGRFRRDLYYRLCGVCLTLPPLRERKEDIAPLVWHFVNLHAHEGQRRIERLDEEMVALFHACDWPGNVRQLRNTVRTALIFGQDPTLSLRDVPFLQAELKQTGRIRPATLRLQELERQAILEALRRTKRNQAKAARLLGITDRTLREKLRRYRQAGDLQNAGEETC